MADFLKKWGQMSLEEYRSATKRSMTRWILWGAAGAVMILVFSFWYPVLLYTLSALVWFFIIVYGIAYVFISRKM